MTQGTKALDVRSKMVGVLVRGARLKAGKTLKECAELLGCSPHTMSQYEYGRADISLPELELLANFFDVAVNHLWDEDASVLDDTADLPRPEKILPLRQKMIGVIVRQARTAAGKTQKECAEVLGVSAHTVSKYEYGKKAIPFSQLELLASYLEVPLSGFLDPQLGRAGELASFEDTWSSLLPQIREFIRKPESLPYLHMALKLYELPENSLKRLAEAILPVEE